MSDHKQKSKKLKKKNKNKNIEETLKDVEETADSEEKSENVSESDTEETAEFDDKAALAAVRRFRIIDLTMVRIFFLVLFAVAVVALIPNLRETYSDSENRELTKFPKFTVESLLSGDYFDGINLWFSDTFPFRDNLIKLNSFVNNCFGSSNIEIHGELEHSDEIPDVPSKTESTDSATDSSNAESQEETESKTESTEETPSESTPSESAPTESVAPPEPQKPTGPVIEQVGALMIMNDTAYEYYNFRQSVADLYASAISRAADSLAGKVNVYDIVVPTSIGVTLPESIASGINSSNQEKAINYIYSKISPNAKKIDAYNTLKAHNSEYLYFRTDHHWTALAAYYTYQELMKVKGVEPFGLDSFTEHQFPGFLGTFYKSSGQNPKLATNPDTVFAYEPPNVKTTKVIGINANKQIYEAHYPIIRDANPMKENNKYLTFIAGDQPLEIIENPAAPPNTVCTVVKESYGNCFIPFLTEHYSVVYVVDYRHFPFVDGRKIQQFTAETQTQDLIFINNMSATRNQGLMQSLNSLIS